MINSVQTCGAGAGRQGGGGVTLITLYRTRISLVCHSVNEHLLNLEKVYIMKLESTTRTPDNWVGKF